MLLWLMLACTPSDPVAPGPTDPATITLQTRDDVTLVADLWPAEPGAGAVILLHMTPSGGWQRTDWTPDLLSTMHGNGLWSINLDRRGAGDSGGVAEDAYLGESGRYDVEAAALALRDAGAGKIGILAASNGTTSMIDYAAFAESQGLPVPAALAYLTGGTYTENQTSIYEIPVIPSRFIYASNEATWSEAVAETAPASWDFRETPRPAHGTALLIEHPELIPWLTDFFSDTL